MFLVHSNVLKDSTITMRMSKSNRHVNNDLLIEFDRLEPKDEHEINLISCYALFTTNGARTTFLMHRNIMIDWICSAKHSDETTVTKARINIFEKHNNYKPMSLILDIGDNDGFYSLLVVKMGFQSIQFDLQPEH